MKILVVCRSNNNAISPFVEEQMDALRAMGHQMHLFAINRNGIMGYLSHLRPLRKAIREIQPDIVHAHYGLSGLLAGMQRMVPVVVTFHGSDINEKKVLRFSKIAHRLAAASIFVSDDTRQKVRIKPNMFTIPCGVDTHVFVPDQSKEQISFPVLRTDSVNILFSSRFSNPVKNYTLAKEACLLAETMLHKKINLIELSGYQRSEVCQLMNAADCLLLTSFTEGSPQFIKEGMACNRPIVSTNVGDVEQLFGPCAGHFLCRHDATDVADNIVKALQFLHQHQSTEGRTQIHSLQLDAESIALKISQVYSQLTTR